MTNSGSRDASSTTFDGSLKLELTLEQELHGVKTTPRRVVGVFVCVSKANKHAAVTGEYRYMISKTNWGISVSVRVAAESCS